MKSSPLVGKLRLVPLRGGLGNQLFQAAGILYLRGKGFNALGIFPSSLARGKHPEKHQNFLQSLGIPIIQNPLIEVGLGFAIRVKEELNHRLSKFFRTAPTHQAFDSSDDILRIAKERLVVNHYFQNPDIVTASRLAELISIQLGVRNQSEYILHVRGGDYLKAKSLFGEVGHEYFREALKHAKWSGKVIIMTDDADYATGVSRCLDRPIAFSGLPVLKEFELALNSEYFVGTNSTLSWWIARSRSSLERSSSLPSLFTPVSSPFHSRLLPSGLAWVSLHDPRFFSQQTELGPSSDAP